MEVNKKKTDKKADEPVVPNKETMRKAVMLDLDAAIYFLHALKENGDFVEELADKMHERYTKGPSLIDQVAQKDHGTN